MFSVRVCHDEIDLNVTQVFIRHYYFIMPYGNYKVTVNRTILIPNQIHIYIDTHVHKHVYSLNIHFQIQWYTHTYSACTYKASMPFWVIHISTSVHLNPHVLIVTARSTVKNISTQYIHMHANFKIYTHLIC